MGILLPWGVIAVAAPWPVGTQPPLETEALIHEKGVLPLTLNDKPVTYFLSKFSDWQSNGVILFSA